MNKQQEIIWALIGAGRVCEKKSMPAMNRVPHSRVKTVMRRNAEACKDFALRHHIPNWTLNSIDIFDDPEVNAVYIATPPDTHAMYAMMAAKAGKAVYVEKPMARNYDECLDMILACREADVPLFVAYYRRALPHFLRVKEILNRGGIGTIRSVYINFNRSVREDEIHHPEKVWRIQPKISGGGHFYDLASHQLDLMDFLFGPIIEAKGKAQNKAGLYEPADTVSAEFIFQESVKGYGEWNFVAPESEIKDEIIIMGDEGELHFSTFEHTQIKGISLSMGQIFEEFTLPYHIQEPLIGTIVAELRGEGKCPSTGVSAARTNRIMDIVCS